MEMESHRRVADDVTPSQSSSTLGGFAVRTDWRRHPTSHPPQARARCGSRIGPSRRSHKVVRNVERRGAAGLSFFVLLVEQET